MAVVPLPSSRRSRPSPRRRAPEIIEAAARVFAERGFHGATTQDIADVLGIRQASLYYYFPSKEGALELVCLQGVAGFFEVAKAIGSGPGTAADKLTRLIKSHLSPGVLERAPAPAGRKPPADRKVVARTGAGVRRRRQGRAAAWRVSRRPRYPPGGSRHPRHGQRGGELVPQRGGGDRPHQRRVRPPYRRRREDAAEAALPPKACAAVRALIPADEAKFW